MTGTPRTTGAREVAAAAGSLAARISGVGRRVVLVHGFTQSSRSWRRLAAELSADHEVVCVDLPGHGGSASVGVASLPEAAELLGATGGRAVYVGYSLGGRCCLTLALHQGSLVERLVLVGATAGIEDEGERAARRAADEALADRLESLPDGDPAAGRSPLEPFLREWLSGPLFAHLSAEQADLGARLVNSGAGLAASLRSMGTGTQRPSWEELGKIEAPTLLVTGALDERFGRLAERMATAIGPSARQVVVPGAGHAVPFEAPDAFAALLRGELTGRSRR